MRTLTAERLKVPGAEIHYEVRGRGPALLMIPGGPTDAGVFDEIADVLSERYAVITYDPRGNSRSTFEGGPPDVRVEVHSDDAARLIAAVDEGPAYVFGSGGGATYGLDLAAFYPSHVRALVAHEAPVTSLLPDAARWRTFNDELHATYLEGGLEAALKLHDEAFGLRERDGSDCRPRVSNRAADTLERVDGNMDLYFRVMNRLITEYVPAVDVLAISSPAVIVGGGEGSCGQLPYRAARTLARKLWTNPFVHFPGDHSGFATHVEEFAERLAAVFSSSEARREA
ncbi:MAG: alpha/beta fold hydrolase [Actinomycetota bacterium]